MWLHGFRLLVLVFLTVFREGAETVLFLWGLMSQTTIGGWAGITGGILGVVTAAGQPGQNDLSLVWARQDLLKAQGGKQYVPFTVTIDPAVKPISKELRNKHFLRKHGPGAYYGQK